ncbi:MAG: tRNA pseudouridine(55) synthase TruB [Candidatus Jacksonbacteria bacterium RIFOXYA2_FULL_43_12]|nr:MAG: tRNA pseudouridine(55) synthase TruB [Candidatus Jacksonbacteria bacterium RIFOXYA2_FULL_43_12]
MFTSGYLLINKPSGPTSHDIVARLRRLTGIKRIGHAGTLDPFATGLLMVGVGREATRNLGKFVGLDKRYQAVIRLGAVSETYDREGKITIYDLGFKIYEDEIKKVIASFIGQQMQVPPQYSAKKVGGKKAYEVARSGQKIDLKPAEIEIYEIKLKNIENYCIDSRLRGNDKKDTITIEVHCSSGTYIRTLAHKIGQKLGCGAYAEELERTAIGNFELTEAVELDKLTVDNWSKHLINFDKVMASGTFEILHPGHEFYLKEAKKLGQKLIVVVARDSTAKRVRGRSLRFNETERLARIKSLEYVDLAVLGDPEDPYQALKKIKPDIVALGYDQKSFIDELPVKIKELGLRTKIARVPAYLPEKYKSSLLVGEK